MRGTFVFSWLCKGDVFVHYALRNSIFISTFFIRHPYPYIRKLLSCKVIIDKRGGRKEYSDMGEVKRYCGDNGYKSDQINALSGVY